MFYLAGVILAFFLDLLILSKRNKSLADKILAIWLILITLHILLFYFFKANLYPWLLGVGFPLPLVHGPCLYLYTRALAGRPVSLKISLLHFLPALGILITIFPFILLPAQEKIRVFQNKGVGHETFNAIHISLIILSGILYVIFSSRVLLQHRRAIVNEFSSTEKINLQWMQYLIYWIGAIWVFVIIGNDNLVFGGAVLFILFIGFFGIRQVRIFLPYNTEFQRTLPKDLGSFENLGPKTVQKKKYQKSGLSEENSESLHSDLSILMHNNKLYKENDLSLNDLAHHLNAPPNYLSQVINEREGKNFYDYINTLRIEEFKRIASSEESRKYTLLGLAQECGFNSKSSFNRYFRKMEGKSPSEFLQSQ